MGSKDYFRQFAQYSPSPRWIRCAAQAHSKHRIFFVVSAGSLILTNLDDTVVLSQGRFNKLLILS